MKTVNPATGEEVATFSDHSATEKNDSSAHNARSHPIAARPSQRARPNSEKPPTFSRAKATSGARS